MFIDDTIVAVSSGTGRAVRMIVRLSGPNAFLIAANLGVELTAHTSSATRCLIRFADLSCPAWIYKFNAPRSYTGQDLIELHIPGNPRLARMLVDWLVAHEARLAEAGEFTARAYFNGKLDLAQAEGVAAAISAQNELELGAARQLMAGELARRLRPAMDELAQTLALVEAGIDFSDERIQFVSSEEAASGIDAILGQLRSLIADSARFEKLTHEPTIVLAGRPNAGKSTLANALAGRNRSVVSPVAGTTRDALSVEIVLRRGVVRLIDIAGLEGVSTSSETIEAQMQEIAKRAIEQADVLVLVRESTDDRAEATLPRPADLRVLSKADLLKKVPAGLDSLCVSVVTGMGMDHLREALDRAAFGRDSSGGALALTSRHLNCLDEAMSALTRAREVRDSAELLAAELRGTLDALGQILGAVSPDDILGRIFSKFCIGK